MKKYKVVVNAKVEDEYELLAENEQEAYEKAIDKFFSEVDVEVEIERCGDE